MPLDQYKDLYWDNNNIKLMPFDTKLTILTEWNWFLKLESWAINFVKR